MFIWTQLIPGTGARARLVTAISEWRPKQNNWSQVASRVLQRAQACRSPFHAFFMHLLLLLCHLFCPCFQLYLISLRCASDQRVCCEGMQGSPPRASSSSPTPPPPLLSFVFCIPTTGKSLLETIISPGKRVRTDEGEIRVFLGVPNSSSEGTAIEKCPKGSFLYIFWKQGDGVIQRRALGSC